MEECIFCHPTNGNVFLKSEFAYALWDAFPVTKHHALVIPRRHIDDYFGLTQAELLSCDELLRAARKSLLKQDPLIEGFNIGVNAGDAAGQTIFHCHFHLIPRRSGDVENPRGGVRNVIPGQGAY